MIDLTLLGCGGNVPMPNRFLSSLFINYKGRKMLIDCGEGTQIAMKKYNCGFKAIDLILITHLHGDHIIGLIGLLQTMGNSGKTDDLTIVGPVGIIDAMNAIKVLVEYLPYRVYVIENPKEKFSLEHDILKDIEISTIDLEHSTECIGYSLYFKRKAKFDREKAYGFHLDIPSGTSVRFEPGEEKEVQLTAIGGTKRVFGLNDLTCAQISEVNKEAALNNARTKGFMPKA